MQAPIGYDVKINFPVGDIINAYNESIGNTNINLGIVNSLYFELPVEEIENDYSITPPPYLLLIKSSDKDNFFAKNKIADNDKTFYAAYDAANKCYTFGNMRNYIIDALNGKVDIADAESMTIVPVDVYSETNSDNYYYTGTTTTTITAITQAVSGPMIGKLKFDEAKIKFVYTKQANNK